MCYLVRNIVGVGQFGGRSRTCLLHVPPAYDVPLHVLSPTPPREQPASDKGSTRQKLCVEGGGVEERSRNKEREKGEKRHRGSGKGQGHGGWGGGYCTARIRRVSPQTVCHTKPWRGASRSLILATLREDCCGL